MATKPVKRATAGSTATPVAPTSSSSTTGSNKKSAPGAAASAGSGSGRREQVRTAFYLAVAALSAFVLVQSRTLLLHLMDLDTGFWNMVPFQRRLLLYSEQAFYYSFYEDFVNAPSISEGLHDLLFDTRSEYPHSINAIERFNVYPEVFMAMVHRTFKSILDSDPVVTLIQYDFLLAGLQWAAVYALACITSRSLLSGVLALVVNFTYYPYATRINTAVFLRENFATPFLWLQILILTLIIQRQDKKPTNEAQSVPVASKESSTPAASPASPHWMTTKQLHIAYVFVTLSFMLSWQFAQFLLLLQSAALFGCYIIGYIDEATLTSLRRCLLLALLLNVVLSLGNAMLLTGLLILFLVSMECMFLANVPRSSFVARVCLGALVVAGFAALKVFVSLFVEDDGHIFRILQAKLFNHEDFMTWLYLCGPTYRAMNNKNFIELSNMAVLPLVGLFLVIIALKVLGDVINGTRRGGVYVWHGVQCLLFTVLGFGIRRLSLVFLPYWGVVLGAFCSTSFFDHMISSIAPKKHSRMGMVVKVGLTGIGLALLLTLTSSKPFTNLKEDLQYAIPTPKDESATGRLMEFINTSVPADAIVSGDPVISSMIKLTTRRRIVIHPHTENTRVRLVHQRLFQLYNRVPEEEVYGILKSELKADYLVLSEGPCYVKCNEGFGMDYVANSTDAYGNVGHGNPKLPQFCAMAQQNPQKLTRFRKVYHSSPFMVLQIL